MYIWSYARFHSTLDKKVYLFLRDEAPLLQDLFIVPAEPVDAFQHQRVAGAQPGHEAPVTGAVKILAALLVRKDPVRMNQLPENIENDLLPSFLGYADPQKHDHL